MADNFQRRSDTLKAFETLFFDDLNEEHWVNNLWNNNFCLDEIEKEEITSKCTVVLSRVPITKWREIIKVTKQWLNDENNVSTNITFEGNGKEGGEKGGVSFWSLLFDIGVSYKVLLAVIYCLLDINKKSIIETISCAQLYFILLQLPGSNAYKIFHPILFQKSLDVFNYQPTIQTLSGNRKRSGSASSYKGKGERKKRKKETDEDEDHISNSDVLSIFEEGEKDCTHDNILIGLKEVLLALHSLLHCFTLKGQEVTKEQIIHSLLLMTRIVLDTPTSCHNKELNLNNVDHIFWPAHFIAWACLDVLCTVCHGALEETLVQIFQHLVPVVVMVTREGCGSTIPSSLIMQSQHAVTFINHVITQRRSSITLQPLRTLLQHICINTPDKVDYRTKLSAVIVSLINRHFDQSAYNSFMEWIYKFSRNIKVSYRVMSMDLASELLSSPCPHDSCSLPLYQFIIKMILSRCSDRSPSVRARALTCLATSARFHDNEELVGVVHQAIFSEEQERDDSIMSMLKRRTNDNKVAVRKAGLQAFEALVKLRENGLQKNDLICINEKCMDPSLSVRKQAMLSLTSLTLEYKDSKYKEFHCIWLEGLLPMILDRENGAKDKCLSLLEEILLYGLTPAAATNDREFVWSLLNILTEQGDRYSLRRCLHFVIEQWCIAGKISEEIMKEMISQTENEQYKQIAWFFLSEISTFSIKSISNEFLLENWKRYGNVTMATNQEYLVVSLLTMICHSVKRMNHETVNNIKEQCMHLLSSFQCPTSVIGTLVKTVTIICALLTATPQEYQVTLTEWFTPLLVQCKEYVHKVLTMSQSHDTESRSHDTESRSHDTESRSRNIESHDQETTTNTCTNSSDVTHVLNEEKLKLYLFTLGELGQLIPVKVSPHTGLILQSLLISTGEGPPLSSTSSSSFHTTLTVSPSLRAHSYVTLGKLCLQNEKLTKSSLVMMTHDLEYSKSEAIRNNIVIAMCDFAVRYSTKVDPYISCVTLCLKDNSLLVRKQTLTLLAHLLQEDYIKWRGLMFFHFLSTLLDKDLRLLSQYTLVHLLLVRQPAAFYNNFMECVFYFNDYTKHKVYNQFTQSDRERTVFSLTGSEQANQRFELYKFLLIHMSDEHRFNLTAKLCHEVLGSVVDEGISLDDTNGCEVIKDTLYILTCKEIKHSSLRQSVEDLVDEGDPLDVAAVTAQTKIISQIIKKNVIENIVPIIIATKHLFEKKRCPLLKELLLCLKELMKDYKNEIKEILNGDPQLAEEIEFDMRKFEEEMKRQRQSHFQTGSDSLRRNSTTAVTPLGQLASPLLSSSVIITPAAGNRTQQERDKGRRVILQSPKLKSSVQKKLTTPTTKLTPNVSMATIGANHSKRGEALPITPNPTHSGVVPPTTLLKTPRENLARLAVLTSARKVHNKSVAAGNKEGDDVTRKQLFNDATTCTATGTDKDREERRIASTPQGYTEEISFNISSMIAPSPIPRNTTLRSYMRSRDHLNKSTTDTDITQSADIIIRLPELGPKELPPWNIK